MPRLPQAIFKETSDGTGSSRVASKVLAVRPAGNAFLSFTSTAAFKIVPLANSSFAMPITYSTKLRRVSGCNTPNTGKPYGSSTTIHTNFKQLK